MKISTETRDRLRLMADDGDTLEDVVITALDLYEAQRFWAQAEHAHRLETNAQRGQRQRAEADVDAWMERLR